MTTGVHIEAGSVTLTNGGAAVVGLATNWLVSGIGEGDWFNAQGYIGYVDGVTDDTHLTLKQPWVGVSGSSIIYLIERRGGSQKIVENQVKLEAIVSAIEAGLYVESGAYGTLAARSGFDDEAKDFVYRVTDDASGDLQTYIKNSATSADWLGPYAFKGEQGDPGTIGPIGPSFAPDAVGLAAEKSDYDDEVQNFAFLDTENSLIYFKLSITSANWSTGALFGKGDKGDAATINVGTTTTGTPGSAAAVVNSGTNSDAVFNFTIPGGVQGDLGWSPRFAIVHDGIRRVLQIADWSGGEGTKPTTGLYIGLTGHVASISDGVDIRGLIGLSGPGTGDMLLSVYDLAANGKVDVAELAEAVEWDNITNKPDTFPTTIDPVAAAIIFGG